MTYVIKIVSPAQRDLVVIYRVINAGHSDAPLKWYRGLKRGILSLEIYPNRCPVTPENGKLRHQLYGNKPHIFQAIYRGLERQKQVDVLHIRYGARRQFKGSEIA